MVQNKKKLGRPLAFKRDEALSAAMNLFWDRGYHSVSLSDLEAYTGLNRSSLYNTFGTKNAVFTQALRHYTSHIARNVFKTLESGTGGLSDLETFLNGLKEHLAKHAGRGCFMVNTMAACPDAPRETAPLAGAYIAQFLAAVGAALKRAIALGDIAPTDTNNSANMLLGVVLGANLLARSNQPQHLINSVLDAALARIRFAGLTGRS